MKGKGIYQVGETKYQLKEGQAFLIEPESLTFIRQIKRTHGLTFGWDLVVRRHRDLSEISD